MATTPKRTELIARFKASDEVLEYVAEHPPPTGLRVRMLPLSVPVKVPPRVSLPLMVFPLTEPEITAHVAPAHDPVDVAVKLLPDDVIVYPETHARSQVLETQFCEFRV